MSCARRRRRRRGIIAVVDLERFLFFGARHHSKTYRSMLSSLCWSNWLEALILRSCACHFELQSHVLRQFRVFSISVRTYTYTIQSVRRRRRCRVAAAHSFVRTSTSSRGTLSLASSRSPPWHADTVAALPLGSSSRWRSPCVFTLITPRRSLWVEPILSIQHIRNSHRYTVLSGSSRPLRPRPLTSALRGWPDLPPSSSTS